MSRPKLPRKLDRTKELVRASTRPYIYLTGKESSLGTSKQKRSYAKASVALGSILKRAKTSVQISNKEKEVSDASASTEFPSKKATLILIAMMEADNSPVPPGFPPKFHLVQARDSTKKDNLANKGSLKSSKRQNDVQNANIGDGENSLHQSQTFSPSIADNEGVEIFEPLSKLAGRVMQNESANEGQEIPIEDAIESAASCVGQDMVRNQGSNEDGKNCGCEVPEELEAWVSRLEKIVAELKAERFGL